MKNKKIFKKLNIYVDSLERKEKILKGAYAEMDYISVNEKKPERNKFSLIFKYAPIALFVFVFSIIAVVLIFNNINELDKNTQLEYSINSLEKSIITHDMFSNIDEAMSLNLSNSNDYSVEYFLFTDKENKESYVVVSVYKVERNGNIDEVLIVSDLKGGLTDYENYQNLNGIYDRYENGEYYSYIFISKNDIKYYIKITSPTMGGGIYYENVFNNSKI